MLDARLTERGMSQALSIYSTKLRINIENDLTAIAKQTGAKLARKVDENDTTYVLKVPDGETTVQFHCSSLVLNRKPVQKHIREMLEFIRNRIGMKMNGQRWEFLHHMSKIRSMMSVFGEPRFSAIPGVEDFLGKFSTENKAVSLEPWRFYDPQHRLLFDDELQHDPRSRVPKFPSGYALKERTEAKIAKLGIKPSLTMLNLPPTVAEEEQLTRPAKEVARRAICLYVVAMRATQWLRSQAKEFIKREGVGDWFTPAERDFLQQIEHSDDEKRDFSWRFEALYTLMWALKHVHELGLPRKMCNVNALAAVFSDRSVEEFIETASLRPATEIVSELDLMYRLHWAVRQAVNNDEKIPAKLSADVIVEWHHALNWLTLYFYKDWDNVTTDT